MGTEPDPLPEGFRVGRYVVERQLGQGPMGRVYKAYDPVLKAHVAVYVLSAARRSERDSALFLNWSRKAALSHGEVTPPCAGASFPIVDLCLIDGIHAAVMMCTNAAQQRDD